MTDRPTRPVEVERCDGAVQPALELVDQRRVDGQARTVVAVAGDDDGVQQVDCPQARVSDADARQADLIADILQPKLGGEGDA